jgi:hypothetical protein
VAADVNGDSKLDLINANYSANTLTVLTNNGSGVFGSNATLNVGSGPDAVLVVTNMDGLGRMALITANYSANTLTVLTNDGSGVFGSNATLKVGSGPYCVAAADVNGDGKVDLISANYGASTLMVLTNNGHGVFGSNATLTAGSGPDWVVAADINGDDKPDLICPDGGFPYSYLTVLTNNGFGVFGSNATLYVGDVSPISVAVADINGDGKPDLISADQYGGSLTVLTNNGHGAFSTYTTLIVGNNTQPYCVIAADLNNNGILFWSARIIRPTR